MKKLLFIILFLLFSVNSYATNYCNDASISACYLVETGSGTTLYDSSSNGYDGSFKASGEPGWATTVPSSDDGFNGISTYSLTNDGTDDVITVSDKDEFDIPDGASLSVVVWVKFTTTTRELGIIGHCPVQVGTDNTMWYLTGDNGVAGKVEGCDGNGCSTSNSAINDGEWHHLAYVIDGTTDNLSVLYVDGVAQTDTDSIGTTAAGAYSLTIGKVACDNRDYWDGYLDEIAVFHRELSLAEIEDIIENGLTGGGAAHRIPTSTELRDVTLRDVTIR